MFYCCGITDKGIMPHNEDAMLIGKTVCEDGIFEKELYAPFVAAVSDGVSGECSGEIASRMCLEKLTAIDSYRKQDMKLSLYRIHRELAAYSETYPQYRNMQETALRAADHIVIVKMTPFLTEELFFQPIQ